MTPEHPVYLAGFWGREHKSEGIADPIYMKAVLLLANRTMLALTFDVVGGDRSFVAGIKRALREKFGLAEEEILINCSHSHSSIFLTGEDPNGRRGVYSIGQDRAVGVDDLLDFSIDEAYFRVLRQQVIESVEYCFSHLQEGRLLRGSGRSDAAVSRRLKTDDGVKFQPNFSAVIDKELSIFQLVDEQNRLIAVLFSYGCHPSSMGGNQISGDFVGHACQWVEDHYPGTTAVFLQGCGGDIKTALGVREGRFKACTLEEMRAVGQSFGEDVVNILESAQFTPVRCDFHASLKEIKLYTEITEVAKIEAMLEDPNLTVNRKAMAGKLLRAIVAGTDQQSTPHYIQSWHLDDETVIIAMEGEIPSEYSLKIKALLKGKKVVVLGYSNGSSTYIPTRTMLREGGYETEAWIMHGFRGSFVPETEDAIIGAIAGLELM
jgi:hypothetical protein